MSINIANPQEVKKMEKKETLKAFESRDDLKFILSTAQGRRFIWRYLEACQIFTAIHLTSEELHFVNGKRSVGLQLLDEVMASDPKAFIDMMKTRNEERNL